MAYYARPEEILYHTHLSQNMLMGAKIALLPGDPGRVQSLAEAMGPAVELVSPGVYKLFGSSGQSAHSCYFNRHGWSFNGNLS